MNGPDAGSEPFGRLLGFPPRRSFVLLPARPRRAALAGLALYDAVYLRQRLALRAGRALIRMGLGSALRVQGAPGLPDRERWRKWLERAAEPVVGPVSHAALRPLDDPPRLTAILCDADGRALAFAKILWDARRGSTWGAVPTILRALGSDPPRTFRVPRLLAAGCEGAAGSAGDPLWLLQEPLPEGVHRRPPFDPPRIRAIVDELRDRLAFVDRPAGTPPGWVPVHGSLVPLNLRLASDGRLWLVDWDRAGFGPRLGDELRYWIADLARRAGPSRRRAARALALLRERGTEDEILEALDWRESVRRREILPAEQDLRDGLARLLGVS